MLVGARDGAGCALHLERRRAVVVVTITGCPRLDDLAGCLQEVSSSIGRLDRVCHIGSHIDVVKDEVGAGGWDHLIGPRNVDADWGVADLAVGEYDGSHSLISRAIRHVEAEAAVFDGDV